MTTGSVNSRVRVISRDRRTSVLPMCLTISTVCTEEIVKLCCPLKTWWQVCKTVSSPRTKQLQMSARHSGSSLINSLNPPGRYPQPQHVWEHIYSHTFFNKVWFWLNKYACMNRSSVKRCKERCLEEAVQLLRQIPEAQLQVVEEDHLLLLVRLLISMQLKTVSISTACRKVDQVRPAGISVHCATLKTVIRNLIDFICASQMLQLLAKVDHQLVYRETHHCLLSIVHNEQVQSSHFTCVWNILRKGTAYNFSHIFFSDLFFGGSAERLVLS